MLIISDISNVMLIVRSVGNVYPLNNLPLPSLFLALHGC